MTQRRDEWTRWIVGGMAAVILSLVSVAWGSLNDSQNKTTTRVDSLSEKVSANEANLEFVKTLLVQINNRTYAMDQIGVHLEPKK